MGAVETIAHPLDQYRSLFENAVEGIYRTTPDGRYLAANPALARIYGYDSPGELIAGLTDIARHLYVNPADRDRFKEQLGTTSVVKAFEAQVYRKDGSVIWISENARAVRDPGGAIVCYEGTVQDITERKLAEDRLRLAAAVFENVGEVIVVTDRDHVVQAVNPAFERMTGFAAEGVVGQRFRILAQEINDADMVRDAWDTAMSGAIWQGELWARRSDGDVFPAAVALTGIADESGQVGSFVMLCRDITRRKQDEERIRYHASHDTLTRLANRHTVLESLKDSILRADRAGTRLALLFLDVNRFKDINDSFGHAAGDELLRQVARRLKGCVRATDIIGRLGGDEFVVALPDLKEHHSALNCVDKILYAFSEPFALDEAREIYCSTSIGVAIYPEDSDSAEGLLTCADAAMYHAKSGGMSYRFYDAEMNRQAVDRINLEIDLRRAVAEGQFRLHYQPKIDSVSGRIVGAEALIRWSHPERGPVSPALFIPVAERAGLVGAIGDWALTEACRQMRAWTEAGLDFGCVSVNLSPAQFHDARLKTKVEQALADNHLPASALELEITETMMATEVDRAITILSDLGQMGVRISIDDFGTGYSSLAYLKLFPVHALKIDRAFVRELPGNSKDGAIVASVVALATNLGFELIAEGVETVAQADYLRARGVGTMQGFLYSPAIDAESFGRALSGEKSLG
ncbi:putative bifunctional diguanylate cyclase/phosphodiesterase [Magnetospirillum moscoviense]|uniref:putative bifunctional diguanylate cyclase/phosphodiesterase n=1 Tax=Magnetospirillum moscoviense TaxID=1437059 RepID=UPI000AFC83E5|nr:EAL domain-containing protein [Magnetospirillum moscoviense]